MDKWKEEIMEAYCQGKTIQSNNFSAVWCDWVPQNQLDKPNLGFGSHNNWRIKPSYDEEREEILKKSGAYDITDMMKEEVYTRTDMLLFAGFCMARKRINPGEDVGDILEDFRETFKK